MFPIFFIPWTKSKHVDLESCLIFLDYKINIKITEMASCVNNIRAN
jgi:hypothetical protein